MPRKPCLASPLLPFASPFASPFAYRLRFSRISCQLRLFGLVARQDRSSCSCNNQDQTRKPEHLAESMAEHQAEQSSNDQTEQQTESSHPSKGPLTPVQPKQLGHIPWILALDGGGVRGLSSLLIVLLEFVWAWSGMRRTAVDLLQKNVC